MGKATWKTPRAPLFSQSKLLCFSLLYLSTSLFLAHYTSLFSKPKCLFRSSHSDRTQIQIQNPLFSYPASYGEHKYALQTLRSNCSSPVFFSGGSIDSETHNFIPFYFFFVGVLTMGSFSFQITRRPWKRSTICVKPLLLMVWNTWKGMPILSVGISALERGFRIFVTTTTRQKFLADFSKIFRSVI